jgi:hypothetical protein
MPSPGVVNSPPTGSPIASDAMTTVLAHMNEVLGDRVRRRCERRLVAADEVARPVAEPLHRHDDLLRQARVERKTVIVMVKGDEIGVRSSGR